jgi:LysM repeat protein
MSKRTPVFAALILMLLSLSAVHAQDATEDALAAPALNPETTSEATQALEPAVMATLPPAPTPTPVNELTYVVRRGDTLFKIAQRYGTTVNALATVNGIARPSLIFAGQTIRIPGVTAPTPTPAQPTAPPTPTQPPVATQDYIVKRGDTLARIALQTKTTIAQLLNLNTIKNPNIIYVGQRLRIPTAGAPAPQVPATQAPAQGNPPASVSAARGYGFDFGVEAYLVDQDVNALTGQISSLGMRWVKQQVNWRDFEPTKGQIDFTTLDQIVNTLRAGNLNILFTVTTSPAWARSYKAEDGPPDNLADYGAFVGALAARYAGQVQAYEIWSDPNIRLYWSCSNSLQDMSYCGTKYIDLLRVSYQAVKAADPAAVVVSAGLAPNGYNDINGISDRVFLTELYKQGLADVSDAVGAHPDGWANPPDATCCNPPEGVTSHYESPTFYFRNTLNDYRQIMVNSGDSSTAIWVTRFGWGSSEDSQPPSQNYIYVSYTSLAEQATYETRAFQLGVELGFIGPMFLGNLNGCQAGGRPEVCYYSLIGPNGQPRPAFGAVQTLLQTSAAPAQPTAMLEATVDQGGGTAPDTSATAVNPETPDQNAVPTIEDNSQQLPPTAETLGEQPTLDVTPAGG